jgi:hypothetical protein
MTPTAVIGSLLTDRLYISIQIVPETSSTYGTNDDGHIIVTWINGANNIIILTFNASTYYIFPPATPSFDFSGLDSGASPFALTVATTNVSRSFSLTVPYISGGSTTYYYIPS